MNTQALTSSGAPVFRLYDSQELLSMDSKVASGYIVLMGGYPTQKKKKKRRNRDRDEEEGGGGNEVETQKLDRGAINLAFMALTEGNVVDACFGAKTHVSAEGAANGISDRAAKEANDAKNMLQEAVRSSDAVREIAVRAYGQAFQIILQYNEDIKSLNFITRCYKWKPIHMRAEESLVEAFRALNEAIEAAS